MRSAMNQLQLSARAYHHIIRLARIKADPAGSDPIQLVSNKENDILN
jgi:predicted ATPase with chaperone activity